jgi:hypothetical protein
MKTFKDVEAALRRTARRKRWQNALQGFWRGLLAGGLLWLTTLAFYKLLPVSISILPVGGVLFAACLAAGFLKGWWRSPGLVETARWVDDRQHLQERISTALEFGGSENSGKVNEEWRHLLLEEAAKCDEKIDPKGLLPFHLPGAARWALLILFVSACLGFVPEYRSKKHLEQQKEAEIMQDTGKRLADLTRRTLEQRPPALETTTHALEKVAELGDQLAKAKLTRQDALKDLASLTEKIQEQTRELTKNPAFKKLEQAARKPGSSGAPSAPELKRQIDSLQKALGQQAPESKELDQLKKELQKAKQMAAGMKEASSGEEGNSLQEELSQTLADLAARAQEMGLSLPNLDEAMAALANSEIDQLLKDLDLATTDLEALKTMAEALKNLQLQLAELGKDLAEQLEKGQAFAAQATLQKMARELRSGNVDQEQMQKMLAEVTKAIEPAEYYGRVAELLEQAARQMQQGDKLAAAEALEEAAEELERMMQSLGDCDSLMATLAALQRAGMCIGNGMGWGMCRGTIPRAGQGGGLGAGVGTWADDSHWLDPGEIKDRWDNSGVIRPDMEARGLSDRGEGQLPAGLSPTKIKGQFTPGGSMPSITLKGVSIKGMSQVDFTETVTAAQSEAQSALSQEQVPRAYRAAVRDYFDDLHE